MFSLIKSIVFGIFYFSGLARISFWILNKKYRNQYIRVVNFHCVSPSRENEFRYLLKKLSQDFYILSFKEFKKFHNGELSLSKPGLLLTFDDGLKSHRTVVAKVLDELKYQGCFFSPLKQINTDLRAKEMDILIEGDDSGELLQERDLVELSVNHIIGSHTISHVRMRDGLSEKEYAQEIGESKEILEGIIGKSVEVFCWVGGEFESYSLEALKKIKEFDYKFSFMTNNLVVTPKLDPYAIQRTNLEVFWPWSTIFISLSGIYDLFYFKKRERIQKKLKLRFF